VPCLCCLTYRTPETGDPRRSGVALNTGTSKVLATIMSDVFEVYSAKKFPGMLESSELSKKFAGQGVRIPVRHTTESAQNGGGNSATTVKAEQSLADDDDNSGDDEDMGN
jgi:Velvet factor